MASSEFSRRTLLQGGAALAGIAFLRSSLPGLAAPGLSDEQVLSRLQQSAQSVPSRPGEEVIPWLDQPPPNPVPDIVGPQLHWEDLDSWITPIGKFFTVKHYGQPEIDAETWALEITGLVRNRMSLSYADIRARPRQEVAFTMECSGNHGFPFFTGAVGNAIWTGAPLAPILRDAGAHDDGIEVIFWGSDSGPGEVNDIELTERYARSMSLSDAMDPRNILCYAMNGEPLPPEHGFPVRLIAPGWYGVANVKWLQRIEVIGTRYKGRFMARDYVTIREEDQDGVKEAKFTSVGRDLLKSAPARVTQVRGHHRVIGVAWGAPIARVEVQIDGGEWAPATLENGSDDAFTWTFWSLEWGNPAPGEHTITSRAIDTRGNIQPAMSDPVIANKLTYWESNGHVTRRVVTGSRVFPETGYTVSGEFLAFWRMHGGLMLFGYPISDAFDEESLDDGQTRLVQYFERARMEHYPAHAAPYDVLLGLLGTEALDRQGGQRQRAEPAAGLDCAHFDATGHNLCGRFHEYWNEHGGLAVFGYPITEELDEISAGDGQVYRVQYFQRCRMEHHPANPRPYDVLLGLLGVEAWESRYGT